MTPIIFFLGFIPNATTFPPQILKSRIRIRNRLVFPFFFFACSFLFLFSSFFFAIEKTERLGIFNQFLRDKNCKNLITPQIFVSSTGGNGIRQPLWTEKILLLNYISSNPKVNRMIAYLIKLLYEHWNNIAYTHMQKLSMWVLVSVSVAFNPDPS